MATRDNAGLDAWRAMLLAYNASMRAIDADLTRAGNVPLTWYDVLLELSAAPGGRLQMQELADRVVLSRTRVSRLADDMAKAGLIYKIRDRDDRRVVWATLTDSGRREFRLTAPRYLRGIETYFSAHLTAAEKAVLTTALTKVNAAHAAARTVPGNEAP
jgi:DNA-binding MarR family transcriptional regulator